MLWLSTLTELLTTHNLMHENGQHKWLLLSIWPCLFLVQFNNIDRTMGSLLELHALTQTFCSYALLTKLKWCHSRTCAIKHVQHSLCLQWLMIFLMSSSFLSCFTSCNIRGIFTAPGVLSYTSTNCVAPLNIVSTGIREGVCLGERREEEKEEGKRQKLLVI